VLDRNVFKVTCPGDMKEYFSHHYCMLDVQKRGLDEQGRGTLERCFGVTLCSGYTSEKAGRPYQPNCNPMLFVSIDASLLESAYRTYLFDIFDKLVAEYDINVYFSSTCPQAWRFPSKMMEAKGERCKKVVDNVYGEPITVYREKITRKFNMLFKNY
jgi:hypothetical protein